MGTGSRPSYFHLPHSALIDAGCLPGVYLYLPALSRADANHRTPANELISLACH